MQIGPQGDPLAPPRSSYVPNMAYAMDAVYDGQVNATITFADWPADAAAVVPWQSIGGPWGRTVDVSADCTVYGEDYLGQLMAETITAAGNGKKAFFKVHKTSAPANVTWGTGFGCPYMYSSGGNADLTFTAPATTQTLTSADTRGTFVKGVEAAVSVDFVPVAGNLHGPRHVIA